MAGCLGFTALILTYAALGAFLFMAIGEWFFSNLIEQVECRCKILCASKGKVIFVKYDKNLQMKP